MKKVAMVFALAVFVPSLLLAWLAVRSIRDQQFVLERQQSLLYQGIADSLSKEAAAYLADRQHDFAQQVETLAGGRAPREVARGFDDSIRTNWPLASVGFVVTLAGDILCPIPNSRPEATMFCVDYSKFLANRESAEVYANAGQAVKGYGYGNSLANADQKTAQNSAPSQQQYNGATFDKSGKPQIRNVVPQQKSSDAAGENDQQFSKVAASEAEFRQIIGDATEGSVARFLQNKLNVLFWYRSSSDPKFVFGAEISLPELKAGLKAVVEKLDPTFREDIAVALLDDAAKPVCVSRSDFNANWKHPFVATEIGESLPHWEVAVYVLNPAKLSQSARTLRLTLGLIIGLLLLAITVGSWLIVTDLNRQLTLARQKTDFVSNVSHELKTPLTSIRMFSELLAEGRVGDPAKQRQYLGIITAEAARLSRLINNVLDFARLERGEKKYRLERCDLASVVLETTESFRPHLEASGFHLECQLKVSPLFVLGDRDALAQIIVNLLSNAEKYAGDKKLVTVELERRPQPIPYAEVRILDRGPGVPAGCEEKIFEKFYRVHDSLSSGVQGSGLGLTLARQIARTHGGDVVYEPRPEGGSCFILRLPLSAEAES